MYKPHLLSTLIVFSCVIAAWAGVVGVFQGRIVRPAGVKAEDGILYVRARNGMARKVRVPEKVVIEFDEDVPKHQRRKDPARSLCDDTLIRVTAEQSDKEDGEWKALSILILAEPETKSAGGAQLKQASLQQKPKEPELKVSGFCGP